MSRMSKRRCRETGDFMPNTQYQDELFELVTTRPFNAERAAIVVQGIPNVDEMITDKKGYSVTLLGEAVDYNNLEAVRFLFKHGADPNYVSEEFDCPFANLMFGPDDDTPEENEIRYKIAKLFMQYGADPNLVVEGETVYDYVVYEVYNHPESSSWEYRVDFYKLLVLYGGGGHVYKNGAHGYGKPELSESIDYSRADDYRVWLYQCEDGYHIEGHLLNPDGEDIGIL